MDRTANRPTDRQLDAQALRALGLTYAQVGELLGITANAARERLVRLNAPVGEAMRGIDGSITDGVPFVGPSVPSVPRTALPRKRRDRDGGQP